MYMVKRVSLEVYSLFSYSFLTYVILFALTFSLSILPCFFPRSLPLPSTSQLIYPMTSSFLLSPSSSITPLFLSRSSLSSLKLTLFIYSPFFSFPQLINPSSSFIHLLFSLIFSSFILLLSLSPSLTHSFWTKLQLDAPFIARFHPPQDRSLVLYLTRSHFVLLFHALHPVRAFLCALAACMHVKYMWV